MAVPVARRLFTVEEFQRMGEAGVFPEGDRVELLDGEIVELSPIGDPHRTSVMMLTTRFGALVAGRALVSCQNPVDLGRVTQLYPDLALLAPLPEVYRTRGNTPEDVFLVVEVADTSLAYDRAKLARYARAGIREAWIVNLNDEVVEVYREPQGDEYARRTRAHRGEHVTPAAFSDIVIAVADVL
ncbi:MAG: Uma2 family endonuclease [Candidatus Rokubacteria bacterium]|nr:Uma2 family endonuclease [Candidatus Rokubacteria bacterium]MBI3827856.1 Uma2 family endonuclease [Candidatus Rokubacteria bacterium]